MPSQVTLTAKCGPSKQNTGLVFPGLTKITIDILRSVVILENASGIKEYDLTGVTAFTDTISGGNHTIAFS